MVFLSSIGHLYVQQLQLNLAGMEPNGASNVAPSAAPSATDLILQQRTGTPPSGQTTVQQAIQKGDGSLWSQVTSNPLFTAVCGSFLDECCCNENLELTNLFLSRVSASERWAQV
jgi:hypothetical protein